MRTSISALALISRWKESKRQWLVQWHETWKAFNLVGGHREEGETFRDCCVREVNEELGLVEGTGFHVESTPRIHLEFEAYSWGRHELTAYTMELFDVTLTPAAELGVETDTNNCWVTQEEIWQGRCRNKKLVSETVLRLLTMCSLVSPAVTPQGGRVLWLLPASRQFRTARVEAYQRGGVEMLESLQNDITRQLALLHPTKTVVVLEQFTGFKPDASQTILLIEVHDSEPERFIVKLHTDPAKLQHELDAWHTCRPIGLKSDPVLMMLQGLKGPTNNLAALQYSDANQFNGGTSVHLEEAFLDCAEFGKPSVSSMISVLEQLYGRLGYLFYGTSRADDSAKEDYLLDIPNQEKIKESIQKWSESSSLAGQARTAFNVHFCGLKDQNLRDPIEYLDYVFEIFKLSPNDTTQTTKEYRRLLVPPMLRGCAHGDLHGRNVRVGIMHDNACWPAVYDYEHMGKRNFLVWDFVKMETELKVRAYARFFAETDFREYMNIVYDLEKKLANATARGHLQASWPRPADKLDRVQRLECLLLTIRRQAWLHLGLDRGRPQDAIEEYYFGLMTYGTYVSRFGNLEFRHLIAAIISAGVALSGYLTPDRVKKIDGPSMSKMVLETGANP